MTTDPATRLYASSIAVVSGLYSIGSGLVMDASLGIGGWVMLVLGIVVLLHGIGLVTPLADSIGPVSGPLMVLWAVVMLLNQGLSSAMSGWMADEPMMASPMEADAGMIAVAVLMLASGLIMSRPTEGRM